MRKTKYYIMLLATGMLTLQSCGDFLKEESQSEVIPKTTDDFSELLLGSGYPDNASPSYGFVEMLDDDAWAYLDYYDWEGKDLFAGSTSTTPYGAYYTWQPYMSDEDAAGNQINTIATSTTYGQFYQKIMGCNAVLDLIDDAKGSNESKARIKAEALALRAFHYFILVNLYGEPYNYNKLAPGVPLKLNADLDDSGIARSTVAEVYENVIVPDLQQAAELMDQLQILEDNYHITQPCIHILLSRVFLFMERYEDCIAEANKALAQGIRLMNLPTEFDKSSLPSASAFFDYAYNPEVLWIFGPRAFLGQTNFKTGKNTVLQALYDHENDVRWEMYGLNLSANTSWIAKGNGITAFAQNIRTAEAYLNKMEAEALLGRTADANNDLNTFCKTRIKDYENVSLNGNELLQTIRDERRKEFCYEGFRWFDLRRYGMPAIQHEYRTAAGNPNEIYTLREKDPLYTIPLPTSLFEKNTLLIQNSSYNSPVRTGVPITNN